MSARKPEKTNNARKMARAVSKCMNSGPACTNALNGQYAKNGLRPNDTIVRFLSLDNFLRMVESQSNVLARVTTWKDVYEGLVFRLQYSDCNVADLLKDFYGQCWTKRKSDSEVLWHARCPNGYGVCLKSTVGKLAKSITAQCTSDVAIAGIGRLDVVTYDRNQKDYSDTKPDVKKVRGVLSNHATLLGSFFEKRYEFNDESEVRVILDLPQGKFADVMRRTYCGDLLLYQFEKPECLVDEVVFHPAMNSMLCECLKCHLQKNGWNNVRCGQSHLYDLPKGALKLLD